MPEDGARTIPGKGLLSLAKHAIKFQATLCPSNGHMAKKHLLPMISSLKTASGLVKCLSQAMAKTFARETGPQTSLWRSHGSSRFLHCCLSVAVSNGMFLCCRYLRTGRCLLLLGPVRSRLWCRAGCKPRRTDRVKEDSG